MELICDKHDRIIKQLNNANYNLEMGLKSLNYTLNFTEDETVIREINDAISNIEDAQYDISGCIDDIGDARENGISMESRLVEYYEAICNLGFNRTRQVGD